MATLSIPTLTLGATVNDKRNVTVGGTMTFDAGDVGKTYRLEIKIYGEDKTGDVLPASDTLADDLLYTYMWAGAIFPRPFRVIAVSAAGAVPFTETRAINATLLDEDPGKELIGWADINTPVYMPRSDEAYASVTLSQTPVSARSATVTAGIGV